MSLKSRKSIDKAGPDNHDETVVTFRREDDKTYTKIIKTLCRDRKSGEIKDRKRDEVVEEGPFEITSDSSNYDERTSYEDIDGSIRYMYFKKILS